MLKWEKDNYEKLRKENSSSVTEKRVRVKQWYPGSFYKKGGWKPHSESKSSRSFMNRQEQGQKRGKGASAYSRVSDT